MATARACWAAPLTRAECRELAAKLARARASLYRARFHWLGTDDRMLAQTIRASIDTSRLLLDVTGQAETGRADRAA